MSSILGDTTVNGTVTQSQPASLDAELIRLGEAKSLMAALFQQAWSGATNYTAGQFVSRLGSLYLALQDSLNKAPESNPTFWFQAAAAGAAGASAYVYVGYASAADGTGFTTTFNASLDYIAIKASTTALTPLVGDFAGLWKNYKGAQGATGTTGAAGTNGANAYVYFAYASDNAGTGFTTTFNASLDWIAIKTTTSVIASPSASDFAGLWKRYGLPALSGTAPITYTNGVIAINAASAATADFVVQRDGNGDFSARKITLGTGTATDFLKLGSASIGFNTTSGAVTSDSPVTLPGINITGGTYQILNAGAGVQLYSGTANVWSTAGNTLVVGALRLSSQSGVLVADGSGNVTGSADTDDLPEGATNLYYTAARVNAAADARIALQKGAASGLATLDGSGKLTTAQIPASLVGALNYQGTWNANTNSPSLASGTGTKGFYYVVSVAGATTLDTVNDWQIGDWVVFNGTVWQKVDNTDSVTSVNGFTGAVVLTTTNVAEGTSLYYTDARVRACVLTGFSGGTGGAISASDTVLGALGKAQNRLATIEAWTTANITENTNLYYTDTRVRNCVLTGFSNASGGAVSATDTVLIALGKFENRVALNDAKVTGSDRALKAGDTFTGPVVHAPTAASSGSPAMLTLTGAAHTTLTASTECIDLYVNLNRVVQFSTGALTTQRAIDITAPKYAFVGASALTDAMTLNIEGAPIGWTNATITNAYALKIGAGALSGTTNGYGLYVDAPTGATNNYGLIVKSGNVGIGTAAPSALLDINADHLRLRTAKTPSSATDTGNAGDICWDSGFVYVCVATNSWKRAAIAGGF